jgi:Fe-S cluster assembly iron-binding protein IscA
MCHISYTSCCALCAQVVPRSSSSEREDASFNNRNLGGVVDFDSNTIMNGTEVQFFDDDFDNHTITNGAEVQFLMMTSTT